jgi:O-antigen ligase
MKLIARLFSTDRITKISGAVIFLLPLILAILYGGNDNWGLMIIGPAAALIFLLWSVESLSSGRAILPDNRILLPFLGLIALAIIQLVPVGGNSATGFLPGINAANTISLDPFNTKIFLIRAVCWLIFFSACLIHLPKINLEKIIAFLAIFGGVFAFYGIIQKLASPDAIYGVSRLPDAIPFASYVNQHHFAALMVLLSGSTIARSLSKSVRKPTRVLFAFSAILMIVAALMTTSRGGLTAYCVMAGILGIGYIVQNRAGLSSSGRLASQTAVALAFILLIILLLIFLGSDNALLRGIASMLDSEDPTSGRLHFWSVALSIWKEHPILGVGMEGFGKAYMQFDDSNGIFRVERAHNDYLQMLTDGGLIGFALLLWFCFEFFSQGIKQIKTSDDAETRLLLIGCLAGITGILVHSFFDFPLRTEANAYFFLLVLSLLLTSGRKRLSKKQNLLQNDNHENEVPR